MTIGLRHPPFAMPGARAAATPSRDKEQLPSIDQFLDELPSIDDFLDTSPESFAPLPVDMGEAVETVATQTQPGPRAAEAGWADGAWQSYDWSSLASLNRHTPLASEQTWGETEWPSDPQPMSTGGSVTPGADEIADALDGMARRIRSGELVIDNLSGTPPEAAMAAALAVLLKMRG